MADLFDRFGRATGYGQMAPGRDLPVYNQPGQPGRPRKQPFEDAIMGTGAGIPSGTFAGANTIRGGATPPIFSENNAPAPSTPSTPSTPDYSTFANTMGQFAIGNGQGYDPAKLADPSRGDSAKYRIGRVLTHFDLSDPRGLLQPGVQEALNAAHLADNVRIVDEDEVQLGGHVDPSMGRTTRLDLIADHDSGRGRAGFLQQDKGGIPRGSLLGGMPASIGPAVLSASSTAQPTFANGENDYAERLRKMIMQAIGGDPQLQSLAQSIY